MAHLASLGRVLLGYSGGVDSTLLAVAASRTAGPDNFLAVLGVSPSLGEAQNRQAIELARRFNFPVREVRTDELLDPNYAANPHNRCYFCKKTLWQTLGVLADAEGWDTIIDGTNADDLDEHRPGSRAGAEHAVKTPLAELGWSKADVRSVANSLGIPIWDAPSSPCLASRIQTGLPVTAERLQQVELGEQLIREVGVMGDIRIRHHGATASIEVSPEMFPLVDASLPELTSRLLALGFESVDRDALGYRRGSLSMLEAQQ
jgi:uncharacterized protein